jgi:hypothetical protein
MAWQHSTISAVDARHVLRYPLRCAYRSLCTVTKTAGILGGFFFWLRHLVKSALGVSNCRLGRLRLGLLWVRHASRRPLRLAVGGWTVSCKIGGRLGSKWYRSIQKIATYTNLAVPHQTCNKTRGCENTARAGSMCGLARFPEAWT